MSNLKKFQSHLRESRGPVWRVAEALFEQGFSPTVKYSQVMEEGDPWRLYADDGDISLDIKIEVKHRKKIGWTCANDFPYDTLLVCAKASYSRAFPKPYAYIHLDDDMSHAAIIYNGTFPEWEEIRMPDERYGDNYIQTAYQIDKKYVAFKPITDDLLTLFQPSSNYIVSQSPQE
ncbi:hypothetical protein [Acinetobacter sp.]|uniref:hypothetical protein n=1 Tax=Acinetobacter sp. TaxID=472 RepID=UPI00257A83A8|nr:hypothetical protein [Acinetobacter sp.]